MAQVRVRPHHHGHRHHRLRPRQDHLGRRHADRRGDAVQRQEPDHCRRHAVGQCRRAAEHRSDGAADRDRCRHGHVLLASPEKGA
nr:hypothetical protein [Ralstonia solanacearum]